MGGNYVHYHLEILVIRAQLSVELRTRASRENLQFLVVLASPKVGFHVVRFDSSVKTALTVTTFPTSAWLPVISPVASNHIAILYEVLQHRHLWAQGLERTSASCHANCSCNTDAWHLVYNVPAATESMA